jgi:hypothetical protein
LISSSPSANAAEYFFHLLLKDRARSLCVFDLPGLLVKVLPGFGAKKNLLLKSLPIHVVAVIYMKMA